jgi:hypothetical protein
VLIDYYKIMLYKKMGGIKMQLVVKKIVWLHALFRSWWRAAVLVAKPPESYLKMQQLHPNCDCFRCLVVCGSDTVFDSGFQPLAKIEREKKRAVSKIRELLMSGMVPTRATIVLARRQ